MSEDQTVDIDATTKLVKFVAAACSAWEKTSADGKINEEDLGNVFALIPSLWPLVTKFSELSEELKAISADEALLLKEIIKKEVDLENDKTETIVEEITISIFNILVQLEALKNE